MIECPAGDWLCPYYDNGDCTLKNCEVECDAFYAGDEEEECFEPGRPSISMFELNP